MKKLLFLFLLPVLILTGCANADAEQTETTLPVETQPLGYYVADSVIEKQTQGAVRQYALPAGDYRILGQIGDQLLFTTGDEPAVLTVLTGIDCVPTAQLSVDPDLLSGSYRVLYNGFAYYDEAENQAIFLDPQLQEINRLSLPEEISGSPVFAPDGTEIFYCAGNEIRAVQTEQKISRLIKSHNYKQMVLIDCLFEGKLLSCRVENEQGVADTVYISAETGQTLSSDKGIKKLDTYEDAFFLLRTDGVIPQKIWGTRDGEMQNLVVDSPVVSALELNGVVSYQNDNTGLHLAFYANDGKKTAAVTLKGIAEPEAFLADRWSGCVWVLTTDSKTQGKILLRWHLRSTPVQEDAVYTDVLYTAQNPDAQSLKDCQKRVDALNKTYGTRIRIWQDAVKYQGAYILTPEYQPVAINAVLDELEAVLSEFPKNFLLKSVSSQIRICIVRDVDGQAKSVQYWDRNDAFIILPVGAGVRPGFLEGLGYVVDSHVLGNSAQYDYWNELNPEGFTYGEGDPEYLSGDKRAFIDEKSMESPADDRSRIFYEAMQPDNAELFRGEIMQSKLLHLCKAIRDAWNLERKTDIYPWEQYLKESIAYQK